MKSFISGNHSVAFLVSLVLLTFFSEGGWAAQEGAKPPPPAEMKKVAADLYFHFDYDSSNSIIRRLSDRELVV